MSITKRHDIGIGSYSVHADQKGLASFVTRMREWLSEVWTVHERCEKSALERVFTSRYAPSGRCVNVVVS